MKIFYYMGDNHKNRSGVSWKMWKIERSGRMVTVWWGPATIIRRRPTPLNTLQEQSWTFPSEKAAKEDEEDRITEKLAKGYKRTARRQAAR